MNILITGSEGLVGKILSKKLGKEHKMANIDRANGTDILTGPLPHLKNIETLIHLAANPNPFINEKEAHENIEIAKAMIRASGSYGIKRIINASSINVYPYLKLFEAGKKITQNTPLSANIRFGDGAYGRAKIETERLFEKYCENNNISLTNLRLGCVAPKEQKNGKMYPVDQDIQLKEPDLIRIVKKCLYLDGIRNYVCVSKRNGFIDNNINFPTG